MKILLILTLTFLAAVKAAPTLQHEAEQEERQSLICSVCNLAVEVVYNAIEEGKPLEEITDSLVSYCNIFNLSSEEVCRSALNITMPTILYIVNHTTIDRGNFCGIYFMDSNCTLSNTEQLEWSIEPTSVPKPTPSEPELPPEGAPTLKVLHLSDIHYDPQYAVGSNANCNEHLCCRQSSGEVNDPSEAAGLWGDYRNCDLPWRTIQKSIEHIVQQHPDIDYVIWTGDLTPHANWATSKEENTFIIQELVKFLQESFPDVPIYPALGNHEAHPVNTFAPPEITDPDFSTQWLYDEADLQWSVWLPAETSSTIRYGGYYTTLVKPGLRIISMNNNYCYISNWWLLYKSQDPASTLLWLSRVLQEAEDNGEKIHIISHIPPGNSDCWTIFSREFSKLVSRYESTIAAQFYGHTHNDEFKIFFDMDDPQRPVSAAFIGPSLTSFAYLNPGYKVYTLDGERPQSTFAVLDHSTWIMNLTAANVNGEADPVWQELYQAKQAYGLTSLRPRDLYEMFLRMLEDDGLFELYYKHFTKNADPLMSEGCDSTCKRNLLCSMVTNDYFEQSRCEIIQEKLQAHQEF